MGAWAACNLLALFTLAAGALWLWSRLWRLVLAACKAHIGISPRAPDWQVYAKLFPHSFPRVVGVIWGLVGRCIPCEILIALYGHFNPWSRKAAWNFRGHEGASGLVALTIDDAPARPQGRALTREVLDVLAEYNATCSFFVVTSYMEGREADVRQLLKAGHEICNHGGKDIPYHRHSKESFHDVLLACEAKINECLRDVNSTSPAPLGPVGINRRNNKWFRPPHARMSDDMEQVLKDEGFRLAMSDCYGMDVMCRPPFIGEYTARHAQAGSIALLHMPEVDFREYNLESLRTSLAGLQARGLRCVSLSELEDACRGNGAAKCD